MRSVCVGILVAGALGCGAKSADPMLTPTLPEPGTSGSPAAGSATPAAPPGGKGLSPAIVQALRGIPLYVDSVEGLLLFGDEQLQAQEILAAWATAAGVTVIPPRRTSEIFTRAALGQHATTGKACGAPLSSFQAVARWGSELAARGKLDARVYCAPDCVIQVSVSIGTEGEGGTEFLAAPFDPAKPWRTELAERLEVLADNGGHNQHGHLNNPVKIAGVPRNPAVKDGTPGSRQRYALGAHYPGEPRTKQGLQIAVYASTTMVPDPSDMGRFKPMTNDPALERWEPPDRDQLAPCFADVTGSPAIESRVTLELDADGKATKANIVSLQAALSRAQQSCVEQAFMKVRVPCPSVAKPTVTADVKASFQPAR